MTGASNTSAGTGAASVPHGRRSKAVEVALTLVGPALIVGVGCLGGFANAPPPTEGIDEIVGNFVGVATVLLLTLWFSPETRQPSPPHILYLGVLATWIGQFGLLGAFRVLGKESIPGWRWAFVTALVVLNQALLMASAAHMLGWSARARRTTLLGFLALLACVAVAGWTHAAVDLGYAVPAGSAFAIALFGAGLERTWRGRGSQHVDEPDPGRSARAGRIFHRVNPLPLVGPIFVISLLYGVLQLVRVGTEPGSSSDGILGSLLLACRVLVGVSYIGAMVGVQTDRLKASRASLKQQLKASEAQSVIVDSFAHNLAAHSLNAVARHWLAVRTWLREQLPLAANLHDTHAAGDAFPWQDEAFPTTAPQRNCDSTRDRLRALARLAGVLGYHRRVAATCETESGSDDSVGPPTLSDEAWRTSALPELVEAIAVEAGRLAREEGEAAPDGSATRAEQIVMTWLPEQASRARLLHAYPDDGGVMTLPGDRVVTLPERRMLLLAEHSFELLSYLAEKAMFLNAGWREEVPGGASVSWRDLLFEFFSNTLYLGTIAASEGVRRVRVTVNGHAWIEVDATGLHTTDPLSAIMLRQADDYEAAETQLRQGLTYLPGWLEGRQAVYTILENVLRNIKHCRMGGAEGSRTADLRIDIRDPPAKEPESPPNLWQVQVWLAHPSSDRLLALHDRIEKLEGDVVGLDDLGDMSHAADSDSNTDAATSLWLRAGGITQMRVCASLLLLGRSTLGDRVSYSIGGRNVGPCLLMWRERWTDRTDPTDPPEVTVHYGFRIWRADTVLRLGSQRDARGESHPGGLLVRRLEDGTAEIVENMRRYRYALLGRAPHKRGAEEKPARDSGPLRVVEAPDEAPESALRNAWLKTWLGDAWRETTCIVCADGTPLFAKAAGSFDWEIDPPWNTDREAAPAQAGEPLEARKALHVFGFRHGSQEDAGPSVSNDLLLRNHGELRLRYLRRTARSIGEPTEAHQIDLAKQAPAAGSAIPKGRLSEDDQLDLSETLLTSVAFVDNRIDQALREYMRRTAPLRSPCAAADSSLATQLFMVSLAERTDDGRVTQTSTVMEHLSRLPVPAGRRPGVEVLVVHLAWLEALRKDNEIEDLVQLVNRMFRHEDGELFFGRLVVTTGRTIPQGREQVAGLPCRVGQPRVVSPHRILAAMANGLSIADDFTLKYGLIKTLMQP